MQRVGNGRRALIRQAALMPHAGEAARRERGGKCNGYMELLHVTVTFLSPGPGGHLNRGKSRRAAVLPICHRGDHTPGPHECGHSFPDCAKDKGGPADGPASDFSLWGGP
jgi:hypothetical protein